jgi:hypothetical protein
MNARDAGQTPSRTATVIARAAVMRVEVRATIGRARSGRAFEPSRS